MNDAKIIVFDGVCALCSGWVGFVLKRDRRREFKLAAMQTPQGRALLSGHGIDPDDPTTFLVIDGQAAFTDTDALIRVLGRFHFGWRLSAWLLRAVPRSWRNAAYRYVARNRYRLFGRRDTCMAPTPDHADRFLG